LPPPPPPPQVFGLQVAKVGITDKSASRLLPTRAFRLLAVSCPYNHDADDTIAVTAAVAVTVNKTVTIAKQQQQ